MTKEELESEIKSYEETIECYKGSVERWRKEIEKLEKALSDLQAQLEQCGNRWRAEIGDRYMFIDDSGDISKSMESNDEIDNFRYNTNNYYQTEELCEAYKQALLKIQECECEIDVDTYDNKNECPNWYIELCYEFDTEQKQKDFAEALKKVLRVKGE